MLEDLAFAAQMEDHSTGMTLWQPKTSFTSRESPGLSGARYSLETDPPRKGRRLCEQGAKMPSSTKPSAQ